MPAQILTTKLYTPPPRAKIVLRPRLTEKLNQGLHRKLTLVSAPAGFGKTTLVSEWVAGCRRPVAWLSLDAGDNDPARFLAYLVAALQTLPLSVVEGSEIESGQALLSPAGQIGAQVLADLNSPHPPPIEILITDLLNEIAALPKEIILVLDDYDAIDAQPVDAALAYLLERLPPQMHLVIATREEPGLPLARLRARDQLVELRAADLRFSLADAAEFLNQMMDLDLSAENIAALENRTEGWIAGLQLAALALQGMGSVPGSDDAAGFIESFTGSHHFVLDYLLEEVLHQQPASVQSFLLHTSILGRLCGPLCDAVLLDPAGSGQETLEYLLCANLFIVPLDNQRRWFRYHQLFTELLRQRLQQSLASSPGGEGKGAAELHRRARQWYEDNGLELEAFHHAAAANDIEHAARLMRGKGMPLHYRGAVAPVLSWLESLPTAELDARPSLWVSYATALMFDGQNDRVEGKLQAAEAALQDFEPDEQTQNLVGHIAAIRAMLAAGQYQVETIIQQSQHALQYLHPDNLPVRTAIAWTLGYAYQLQGDRPAAGQAYTEAISISQVSGNTYIHILAAIGLGNLQEADNDLYQAAQTYRSALQLAGELPHPAVCEAHLGLARISYEWNDLDAAGQHAQECLRLAQQIENADSALACQVFLSRLKLALGDAAGAAAILAQAAQSMRQYNLVHRTSEVAAVQVLAQLHQGNLAAAARLARTHELPLNLARVHLARGDASVALAVLEPLQRQVDASGWQDERLKVMVLHAAALHAHGDEPKAVRLLEAALALAEPGGFIRIFIDEGAPMTRLLSLAASAGTLPEYTGKLLDAFQAEAYPGNEKTDPSLPQPLIEPLSARELEVLQLIAQGLSNREIGERLSLALNTVKGHIRKIFAKLQVKRRTEAVARARQLALL